MNIAPGIIFCGKEHYLASDYIGTSAIFLFFRSPIGNENRGISVHRINKSKLAILNRPHVNM